MRLLQCLQDDVFKLTSFDDEHPPPYAILSHTWIEGQEVTYNEVVASEGKNKLGYAKLRFCSKQAAADGLQYFWVDTCCIDKSNSIELSTAINSMFRWYQRAAKCYVYLSDVSVPEEVVDAQVFRITWEEAFRRSRWFTRGWTLQELLAPPHVEFFSREGKQIGSKISLEQEIHEITRISIRALRSLSLHEFSVEVRASWAARRRTTVKEDNVYCLLGIFGVFLPLIYGEGEDHAMLRLREEIQKRQQRQAVANLQDLRRAGEVLSTNLVAGVVQQSTILNVDDDPINISASERHDLEAALADLSGTRHERLDWQHSVVDLLKLFDLHFDAQFRGWLADTLDIHAGPIGSTKQNNALRKAIIEELAAAEIAWTEMKDARFRGGRCLNCGRLKHSERKCQARCGKCLHFSHTVSQCRYPVRCIECRHIGHLSGDCQEG